MKKRKVLLNIMSDKRPVGVFDSGVGGLTVVSQMYNILPEEDIIYFGDTAHVPYGTKSKDTVTRFCIDNVNFLMTHNVKVVVVACNTASSLSLDFMKRCFRVPLVGVIEPGAKCAVSVTRNKKIGVIGTNATILSGAYEKAIKRLDPKIKITARGCPLFVPLAEEGWLNKAVTRDVAIEYLAPLRRAKVDTLILGCTHYPLLRDVIKEIMGSKVMLVDSAREVAKEVRLILDSSGLLNDLNHRGKSRFYVSDEPPPFVKMAEKFLHKKIFCNKRTE